MTTIVAGIGKRGHLYMAGDSQITGDYIDNGQYTKVHRINGCLVGMAGSASDERGFIAWLKGGNKPKINGDEFQALVLKPNGVLLYYDADLEPGRTGKPAAIGSGSAYALGAMYAGADPAMAVRAAKKYDKHTGGRVWSYRLGE